MAQTGIASRHELHVHFLHPKDILIREQYRGCNTPIRLECPHLQSDFARGHAGPVGDAFLNVVPRFLTGRLQCSYHVVCEAPPVCRLQ